jgi:hypothetical protein
MARNTGFLRRIAAAVLIGALELTAVAAVGFALDTGAYAQRYRRSGPGFFESLFGPSNDRDYGPVERAPKPVAPAESSRAPPPRKSDTKSDTTPTITVMVMGDELADWLAYGLEDAFSDTPEIGVVRKTKPHSGLIRYDSKSDLDWWHVARDDVTGEKADYVVMMLGVEDRQNIRDVPPPDKKTDKKAEADKKPGQDKNQDKNQDKKADQKSADQNADDEAPDDEAGNDAIIAAEPKRGIRNGIAEFRSEAWEQIYTKRIDDTIAAMKSKGVPVLWVGLPSIRGTKSTADAVYLNDLYRARAEKAGIVYVDIWDGFVDENGKFSYYGPDFEGQNRRLRAGDGVNFTKSGARKLAHYVERELRRFIANRALPVSLPAGTQGPALSNSPAARPVAGPVLPLTGNAGEGNELLGGNTSRPALSDPVATQVLVKGEPIAPATGRADDFHWPRDGKTSDAAPPASAPAAISPIPAKPAVSIVKPAPAAHEAKREPPAKSDQAIKPATRIEPKVEARPQAPKQAAKPAPRPDQKTVDRALRPPAPIQQQSPPRRRNNDDGGLFGLFR